MSGSVTSLAALRLAVVVARDRDAILHVVLVKDRPSPPAAPRSLRHEWLAEGYHRLRTAFDESLGGMPDGLRVTLEVIPGQPAEVLTALADLPDDLLVVSRGRPWSSLRLGRSVDRQCLEQARCPVLITPALRLGDPAQIRILNS